MFYLKDSVVSAYSVILLSTDISALAKFYNSLIITRMQQDSRLKDTYKLENISIIAFSRKAIIRNVPV
jgi:hypothetical protein